MNSEHLVWAKHVSIENYQRFYEFYIQVTKHKTQTAEKLSVFKNLHLYLCKFENKDLQSFKWPESLP